MKKITKESYMNKKVIAIMKASNNSGLCACCGKVLDLNSTDLHHRDSSTKLHNPSYYYGSCSVSAMLEEVAKCDALCTNCHNTLHYVKGTEVSEQDTEDFYKEYRAGSHNNLSVVEYYKMLIEWQG